MLFQGLVWNHDLQRVFMLAYSAGLIATQRTKELPKFTTIGSLQGCGVRSRLGVRYDIGRWMPGNRPCAYIHLTCHGWLTRVRRSALTPPTTGFTWDEGNVRVTDGMRICEKKAAIKFCARLLDVIFVVSDYLVQKEKPPKKQDSGQQLCHIANLLACVTPCDRSTPGRLLCSVRQHGCSSVVVNRISLEYSRDIRECNT